MSNIVLNVIATGKYHKFVEKMLNSATRFFLVGHNVEYRVFSDMYYGILDGNRVQRCCDWKHLPWPLPTLLRYHAMTNIDGCTAIKTPDFIFYIDADMEFVAPVGDEILGDLVAVQHPGFAGKPRSAFTYETNPHSAAYVGPNEGTHYLAGGFQGGSASGFGKAMAWMRDSVTLDLGRHIIAKWHDESYWQRYLIDNPPSIILPPTYCCPETWPMEGRKILALDKQHAAMRTP